MYFSSPTYQIDGVTAGTSSIDCRRSHLTYMDDISRLGDESNPPCSTGGTTASPPPPPPPTGCTTVSGESCVFPFRFRGVLYNECTFEGNAPEDTEPWCSTLTDSNDDHVSGQGKWGFCASNCPVVGGTTSAPPTNPPPTTTTTTPTCENLASDKKCNKKCNSARKCRRNNFCKRRCNKTCGRC